jgi:hypothetical protein
MEEIFKGLIERAQYYEQFESFRNTNLYERFVDTQELKMKAPIMNV